MAQNTSIQPYLTLPWIDQSVFSQHWPNHGQNMWLKKTPSFNQTREDQISKNHNLKGNESKLKYFYSKIINLDKPEQITFIPRNLIIYTHWWWEPHISRWKHSRISADDLKEPGERQISYQAMTFVRFRIVPWALKVCKILTSGEPKTKLTLANITKA